ncbi:MAG TPA: glutamate--tRNA ligase [Fimbriimonadales bacterium]|nr:glutamate--tRNA ligase [Fimbriimonadales bacterium]
MPMVRVRYAPSPTGSPHVGNIRTALFNYLMARRHGGKFIVRIEDTDRAREVEGALQDILDSLRWLGIDWDEGPEVGGPFAPYFQSERTDIYRSYGGQLVDNGHAYPCFCTPEILNEMREYQRINKLPTGYDRRCRRLSKDDVADKIAKGTPFVVRLAMPLEGTTVFEDAVRGKVEYENALVDDQVLLKSDGWPTYHLANVVDDHLQDISHVIRGEEWISSTPKHIQIYKALGWEPPIFAHAPVIKGPDGSKLSKRHGDTRCLDYREKGFLGPAVANFIALIGWSPKNDVEVMSLTEMASAFAIDGIQPSPGVFDIQKLHWMNGVYIRALSPEDLYDKVRAFDAATSDEGYLESPSRFTFHNALETESRKYVTRALVLEQERVKLMTDFPDATEFFFDNHPKMDRDAAEKWRGSRYVEQLFHLIRQGLPEAEEPMSPPECEELVTGVAQELKLQKRGDAIHPLRLALTGRTKGPGLFELMSLLGPTRMRTRLELAQRYFG